MGSLTLRGVRVTVWGAGAVIALLVVVIGLRLLAAATASGQALLGVALTLPVVLEGVVLGTGVWMLGTGWPGRAGYSLHCAKCNYQRVEETDRLLAHCPECGHTWRYFGGWRVGKPVGSVRRVRIGMVLCVIALGAMFARSYAGEWIAGRLPTGLLMRQVVYGAPGGTEDFWRALSTRPLGVGDRTWIAAGLLDRRQRVGVLDLYSQTWLEAAVAQTGAGALPTDVVARYYAEAAEFELDVPESVKVGQTIEATVIGRSHLRGDATPLGTCGAVVESIQFEMPKPPTGSGLPESALPAEWMARGTKLVPADNFGSERPLSSSQATSLYPGKCVVRAVVWLIVGPPAGDGATVTTGQAPQFGHLVERARRVELEQYCRIIR